MILDRSLKDPSFYDEQNRENCLITLMWLADGGHFENTRQMIVTFWWPSILRLHRVTCSMANLEKIEVNNW
jgi:hypothetical protein